MPFAVDHMVCSLFALLLLWHLVLLAMLCVLMFDW
jgi:hypothetical protein